MLKDLCEEGWQKLLEELDSDNDGKISLSEFEALRTWKDEVRGCQRDDMFKNWKSSWKAVSP